MKFEFFIHDRRVRPWARRLLLREVGVAMSAARQRGSLPRFELGNMRMAIAGRALSGDSASRGVRSGTGGWAAVSRLLQSF